MKNLIVFFLLFPIVALCQNNELIRNYSLSDSSNYFQYNDEKEALIGVHETRAISYEYDDLTGKLVMFSLTHRAFILNTDEEIESNNKLYIPFSSSTASLEKIDARVIKKNGEIIPLDKSKILTAKDEETDQEYKYYAYEGIEKGCVIEYFTLIKKRPYFSGTKETVQGTYPIYNYDFHLYSPSNLKFKFRINGEFENEINDTLENEVNHWQLHSDKVVALEKEEQAAYKAHVGAIIYKLDKNFGLNKYDITSYVNVTQSLYENLFSEYTKAEKKALKKILKETSCITARNQQAKVRAIEDHIKQNYQIVNQNSRDLIFLSTIYDKKFASKTGVIKLFIALFKEIDMDFRLVITCSRFEDKFDQDFHSYHYLDDYLFYFPKLKLYLSPTEYESRLGYPPPNLTANYGLFIKEVSVSGIQSAISKIRYIDPIPKEQNKSGVKVEISLDENDIFASNVFMDRSLEGYNAMYYQPYFSIIRSDEDKEKLTDDIISFVDENLEIENKKVYYDDAFYFGIEPFRVTGNFKLEPLIQKAGDDFIVELGKLIGPQMEMYQESERILPVESRYLRVYEHELVMHIPEKYTVKNLDDINIHEEFSQDGEVKLFFDSSYTFEDHTLVVHIKEYYDLIEVAPEHFNDYRRIVNCAANFNKVALVIE